MDVLLITWACDLDDVSEPSVSASWVKEISRDHNVTIFAVSRPDRFGCVRSQFPNLEVIEWSDIRVPKSLERFRAILKPGYLSYYIRARLFLKALIKERHFDVIHHLSPFAFRYPSPAYGLGVPLIRGPVAGGVRTPVGLKNSQPAKLHPFMFLRNTDAFRLRYDPILRRSYQSCDHVLFAAPYVRELMAEIPLQDFSIEIELGLDSGESDGENNRTAEPDDKVVNLLYVGRVIPTKGLWYAIKALASIESRNRVRLTVVGDGEDLMRCKALAQGLGVGQLVRFMGWRTKSEVREFYKDADIFLFPSYREPTGGVLLEAMTHGLPCITTSHGGTDYMIDHESGIKVSPASDEKFILEIAQAIDLLSNDRELRSNMGKAAYSRAKAFFGWSAKRHRISNIYQKVVDRNQR